jgi:hypothetical protein
MLDQPRPGARHKLGEVENGRRLPAKIGHQSAFCVRDEFAASEQPKCRGVVLEQGPATPAIECPDRGDPRRHAIDLPAEVIEICGGISSTELSVLPVILRKPICRASANRFNGPRRSWTETSSSSSSVKKCSISSADSVAGNRSSPRYRCSHRLIGGFFVELAALSGMVGSHDAGLAVRRSSERR